MLLRAELVDYNASNLRAEFCEPTRAGSALPAQRRASLPILREGTRSRRRHGSLIGARRVGAVLKRLGARPTGRASALHSGACGVLAGLAGVRNRAAAGGGVGAGLVLGEPRRPILVTYAPGELKS